MRVCSAKPTTYPKRRGRYAQAHGRTSTHDFPTGRLCLQAYSPYPRTEWTQQWRETPARDLSGRIPAIVRELEKATAEIARLVVIERLRQARALVGSTDALKRFNAWRAPEKR
jgi:hypothetical protein